MRIWTNDCPTPPKGTCELSWLTQLIQTVPALILLETRIPRLSCRGKVEMRISERARSKDEGRRGTHVGGEDGRGKTVLAGVNRGRQVSRDAKTSRLRDCGRT